MLGPEDWGLLIVKHKLLFLLSRKLKNNKDVQNANNVNNANNTSNTKNTNNPNNAINTSIQTMGVPRSKS